MSRNRWRFSKPIIAMGVFVLAVGLLAGLTVFTFGQQRPEGGRLADPRDSLHVPILTFGPQVPAKLVGVPDDWTHHHLVFSNPGTEEQAFENGTHDRWLEIVNDPRFILQGLKRDAAARGFGEESTGAAEAIASQEITEAREAAEAGHFIPFPIRKPIKPPKGKIAKDWSEGLNAGAINPNTFPAKWSSFNTSSASCGSDFVIYPTGMAGTTSQASIISYYNLYSGCTSPVPKVDWAYNTGSTVSLSPAFSNDGSQVAFVQTSSSVASLVLLRFPLTPPGTGTLTSPITLTSQSSASDYYNNGAGCAAPCMYTVALSGSPNDTWSSPYYDFWTDSLYVGDAAGKLHKFYPVFTKGAPAEVTSSWPVQLKRGSTSDTTQTSSPVYDPSSGNVFVGTFGGYLYSVGSGNAGTTSGTIDGYSSQLDTNYGIRDAVLVDSTAQVVYAFVGYDSSGDSGVYQFSTAFTSSDIKEVELGTGATSSKTTAYEMAGAFDNTYYTSSSSASPSGNLYACATGTGTPLYKIAISGNVMGTATSEFSMSDSTYYGRCSPITEFLNYSASTTLSAGITSTNSTSVSVASGTGFSNNDYIQIDSEIMQISSGGGTTALTVTRGQLGTTAATHSSGATVNDIHDYIFVSVFGALATIDSATSGCTDGSTDGCILSFNVTNPSAIALSGTGLNVPAIEYLAPTGGLIIDNSATSPSGTSQIYFVTTDNSTPAVSCSTSGTGVCAVQASQTSP